jgi:hypothetical protein
MLFKEKMKNLTAVYPQLSRVWIKTGDPRMPLKGVWIDEAMPRCIVNEFAASQRESETTELAEDHLLVAA